MLLIKQVLREQQINKGDVIEIGCYPGRYLRVFGDAGMCLHGIDTTPKVETELKAVYQNHGYCVGDFIRGDIFKYSSIKNITIACSFGFIEHFENFEEVVLLHTKFVSKGGLVIITVPNFSGFFQKYFHYFFDKENLDRHNLKAMNVDRWIAALNKNNIQYELIFKGAFGELEFWFDEETRSRLKRFIMDNFLRVVKLVKRFKIRTSKLYSPYYGLVIKLK